MQKSWGHKAKNELVAPVVAPAVAPLNRLIYKYIYSLGPLGTVNIYKHLKSVIIHIKEYMYIRICI